jgi:SAM-dependent methyltransferase
MNEFADEKHLEPYREAVERFGPTFEAMLWGSREAQLLRFDVMLDLIGRESLGGCRLLDVGCGRGDLAQRLIDQEVDYAHYTGIDALPAMIDEAGSRHFPRCRFEVANVLADLSILSSHASDFTFISGTLNTMADDAARRLVRAAFDAAAQGVAFNFLSNRFHPKWKDQALGPAHRFDTVRWLDWAMSLTPRVSFAQDYLDGHDATILVRHA